MSDREQNIAESIAYLEFIRDNHARNARNLNAAQQIHEQLENAGKDGKVVQKISVDMDPQDESGRDLDPNVFRVEITSTASGGETSKTTIHHNCASGSTTVIPSDAAETTVKTPNDEKPAPYDARLDYYNRQIELIKSMQKKK